MKLIKTDEARIMVGVSDLDETSKIITILCEKENGKSVVLPSDLCKKQFTDADLVKHILNFFIKE